ncbi:MAG: acyl carrier protein [Candidatus Omnitrophota bacterium]
MHIKEELRRFIISNYLKSDSARLDDGDSFLEKGIIDSIGVIELASFIQEKYGIKIEVPEIMPENFDTLNNLERYITKKLKSK